MVKIRLKRMGKKKKPFYKIVAADARSPRDGRFIEDLGNYDPNTDPAKITFKTGMVEKWIKNGAQPTATVRQLMKNEGLMLKLHLLRGKRTEDVIAQELEKFEAEKPAKIERIKQKLVRKKQRRAAKKAESKQEAKS